MTTRTTVPKSAGPSSRFPTALALVLLTLAGPRLCAQVRLAVQPQPPVAGETAHLVVITETRNVPVVEALPEVDCLRWLTPPNSPRKSIRSMNVNGRVSQIATAIYDFRADAPGRYRIPSLTVKVDELSLKTAPLEFNATKGQVRTAGGSTLSMDEALFSRFRFDGGPRPPERLFVGQAMRVTLHVYVLQSIFEQMGYPEIEMADAVFQDFSNENRKDPRFRAARLHRVRQGGRMYIHVPFTFVVSPIKPGKLGGTLTVRCEIEEPGASSRFDSFFQLRSTRTRKLVAELPGIPVQALPPVPEGQLFLGLVGDWRVSPELEDDSVRAGESVALSLRIEGGGPLEMLSPPELDIDAFRVFEPEVERSSGGETGSATLTWVLVPLSEQARLPELVFSTFDPRKGTYRAHAWTPRLEVLPAQTGDGGAVVVGPTNGAPRDEPDQTTARTDILYVKETTGTDAPLPLWHRALPFGVPALLGPLAYGALSLIARHRRRLTQDAGYRRRSAAGRRRTDALRHLRRASPEQRSDIVREELAPALCAGLDLPPGTTPTELAQALRDEHPDLAEQLRLAEESRYLPAQSAALDVDKIVRGASKLFVLLWLLVLPVRGENAALAQASAAETDDALLDAARAAYDRGRLEEALETYRALSDEDRSNAALLYNQANCLYRLGQPGPALALYERARRLAPRDSDIAENLRFVRRQLGLPDRSRAHDPFQLLAAMRDTLRPDEWMVFAACALLAWGLVAGGLQFRRGAPRWLHGAVVAVLALSILSVFTQYRGPYRSDVHAVVVAPSPELLRLPDADSEALEIKLREGQRVRIVEARTDWMRIAVGENEGWLPREDAETVW